MRAGVDQEKSRFRWLGVVVVVGLCPLLMGGCPASFRNTSVDAFETAARGVMDAALDLVFDELRTNDAN